MTALSRDEKCGELLRTHTRSSWTRCQHNFEHFIWRGNSKLGRIFRRHPMSAPVSHTISSTAKSGSGPIRAQTRLAPSSTPLHQRCSLSFSRFSRSNDLHDYDPYHSSISRKSSCFILDGLHLRFLDWHCSSLLPSALPFHSRLLLTRGFRFGDIFYQNPQKRLSSTRAGPIMSGALSKRQQARNERALQDLIKSVPGNNVCADCQARNPGMLRSASQHLNSC